MKKKKKRESEKEKKNKFLARACFHPQVYEGFLESNFRDEGTERASANMVVQSRFNKAHNKGKQQGDDDEEEEEEEREREIDRKTFESPFSYSLHTFRLQSFSFLFLLFPPSSSSFSFFISVLAVFSD